MSTKLYYVQCRGSENKTTYQPLLLEPRFLNDPRMIAYVVSDNAETAYLCLREYLDSHKVGTPKQRSLWKLTLVAECPDWSDIDPVECGMMLLGDMIRKRDKNPS